MHDVANEPCARCLCQGAVCERATSSRQNTAHDRPHAVTAAGLVGGAPGGEPSSCATCPMLDGGHVVHVDAQLAACHERRYGAHLDAGAMLPMRAT